MAIYDLDEERNLIAMELCRGGTLRDLLQRGRLAPLEALRRGVELTTTLEAVHRAGIVHRDLKPGNLLFRSLPPQLATAEEKGDLVLGDFGLAHLDQGAPQPPPRATPSSVEAVGTLGYMAPEQRRGEASPAADLYAVGVILHEMLVGAPPFDRAAVLRGELTFAGALPEPVVAALGARTSDETRALLALLLAADPAARPSAGDARARLAALRDAAAG
jgi:serine/threonine protein kinase